MSKIPSHRAAVPDPVKAGLTKAEEERKRRAEEAARGGAPKPSAKPKKAKEA